MTVEPITIESLDQEGRGVAHAAGKTVFIEGALPGEEVTYSSYRKKPNYELARVVGIERPSAARVTPRCRYFGVCGGCSMQHLDAAAQVAAKQRVLEDALWHIARVRPDRVLPPIHGPAWEYRHRARLAVRYVAKKGGVLVGFHERKSSFVADMASCEVLPRRISALLIPLRELIGGLSIRDRCPQIEVAVGDQDGAPIDVLVLRILASPNAVDRDRIRAFADLYHVQIYLQPQGPESAHPWQPQEETLRYTLPELDLTLAFRPTEFTQVNAAVNRVLIRLALTLLAPRQGERIADFFCGLGNFTLPIARLGATVVGVEGSPALVARAQANAAANQLGDRVRFCVDDLFQASAATVKNYGVIDKALIDPPREGAIALIKALAGEACSRVVYVSCNPATLARDAAILVHQSGYCLAAAGVVNMFPHTAHVESIALFERPLPV